MLFPQTTIGDLQLRLLLIRPDLNVEKGRPIDVTHRFDTIIGEGRTTIEERYPGRATWLLTQRCTLPLVGAAADDFRKGTAALGSRLVGVPLWIDALPVARWAERIYDPQKVINFNASSGAFAIYDGGSIPGVLAHPLLAPLLVGRWRERPGAEAASDSLGEVEVTISEASPFSCRIGIHTQVGGWTALPDRSNGAIKDRSEYGLELLELGGAAREPALDRVNASARWTQEGGFTFRSRVEARQHLTHFLAKKGALLSWSPVPAWFQRGADTPDTPDNYTARFTSDELTLSYTSGKTARTTVSFTQEIDTGLRSQSLAGEAYLYTFTYQRDSTHPELVTSWDAPLVGTEGTFNPDQCVHDEILASLRPQDAKAELKVAYTAGSLMADWEVGRLFGWVSVKIERCDPDNVASTRQEIFSGYVRNVLPNGNTLKVTATLLGKLLDKKIPSDVDGPQCNAKVFDARCGLVEADFISTATLVPGGVSADGRTLTLTAPSGWGDGGTGTYADNWFAPNGILRTGTEREYQSATITGSEMSGADLVVTLSRPLFADMVDGGGQDVTLVPGCGGQYQLDCITKFNNGDNFRGFPFMPDYIEQSSPSMPKAKK